jgi:hypothetical protein
MQAEALKRMGRGPDTQLIHMTDSEIDALNGLSALVFNEPLRTNPQTGLPEAGLFKKLLPTVLAIGAATFMGPAAAGFLGAGGASGLGLSTGLATGLGTGLAAFGGHLAGQAVTGQDLDFGRAALAGAGSGLMAGFGAASDASTIADAAIDPTTGIPIDAGSAAEFSGMGAGSAGVAGAETPVADALQSLAEASQATGPGGMRTFSEGFDYLTAEPGKRILAPLALAGAMGEFDEPLPEAPTGPEREPFVPTKYRATRERRDLDLDEDGEVTEKDIMQVVQALPEGQSSRFYTPTQFTPLSTGGLVNLEQGGSVKQAIQNLTGGEGSTVLPMIAQAVVKPGEEEEEEATTKGYPLGTPGTPPGMPTTGIAIGGGQPPQPFQVGGPTALDRALGGDDAGLGVGLGGTGAAPAGPSVGVDVDGASTGAAGTGSTAGTSASPAAAEAESESEGGLSGETIGGLAGSAVGKGISIAAGLPTFGLGSLALGLTTHALGRTIGKEFDQPAPISEAEAATEAAAQGMAGLGMDLGDTPDESGKSTEGIAEAISEAMAETAAEATGSEAGTGSAGGVGGSADAGPGSGHGDDGTGGPGGEDDGGGGDADGSDADGPDSGDADADSGDPIKTGGQAGIGMQRLLKFEQGGLAGIPYFEGRVMPTGDPKEDGMSDNIPFVIAGQEGGQMQMQPAILSPDEYVIPADVVSMLGNGSSTAGSNQLDQFISNFRMEKYGRPKQPPEMRGGLNSLA